MNQELENLINMVLAKGELTDKDKETILRKAEKLGEDKDEIELILDGRFHLKKNEIQQEAKTDQKTIEKLKNLNIGLAAQNLIVYSGSQNRLDLVKLLIEAGVNINDIYDGWSAIQSAAFAGNVDILKYLIENNANINIQNELGNTPLILSIGEDKFDCFQALVKSGADLNIKNNFGLNALASATILKRPNYITILKDAGAEQMSEDEVNKIVKNYKFSKVLSFLSLFRGWRVWVGIFLMSNIFIQSTSWFGSSHQDEYESYQWLWFIIGGVLLVNGLKRNHKQNN